MSIYTTHRSLPEGGMIMTATNGKFDWINPSGRHHRGQAADRNEAVALEAAGRLRDAWILAVWEKGEPVGGGVFKVKLK